MDQLPGTVLLHEDLGDAQPHGLLFTRQLDVGFLDATSNDWAITASR
jgi:hypothetical protein